jgi:dTDP-4-amino-4,6-dideoxygalactose transaminase
MGYKGADTPIAEDFAARVVSLPIYPELSEADFGRVRRMLEAYGG